METDMDNEIETGCMQGFLEIMQNQTGYLHWEGKIWADSIPLDATKPSNRVWSRLNLEDLSAGAGWMSVTHCGRAIVPIHFKEKDQANHFCPDL